MTAARRDMGRAAKATSMGDDAREDTLVSDSTKDRIGGAMDQAKGNVKEGVGDATGDERTKSEGQMDQASGDVKQGVADIKDKVGDAVKNVTDRTR